MDSADVAHVYTRAARHGLLVVDDQDRDTLADMIRITMRRFGIPLYAFCVMSTHYHLLIRVTDELMAKAMQVLNYLYTVYFNERHKGTGHVLEGPYKWSRKYGWADILAVFSYIHLNPLDALAEGQSLESYRWSSLRAVLGLAPRDGIDLWVLTKLDTDFREARRKYTALLQAAAPSFREASRRKAGLPTHTRQRNHKSWQEDALHELTYYLGLLDAAYSPPLPSHPRTLTRCPRAALIVFVAVTSGLGSIRRIASAIGMTSAKAHRWIAKLSAIADRPDTREYFEGLRQRALAGGVAREVRA